LKKKQDNSRDIQREIGKGTEIGQTKERVSQYTASIIDRCKPLEGRSSTAVAALFNYRRCPTEECARATSMSSQPSPRRATMRASKKIGDSEHWGVEGDGAAGIALV